MHVAFYKVYVCVTKNPLNIYCLTGNIVTTTPFINTQVDSDGKIILN